MPAGLNLLREHKYKTAQEVDKADNTGVYAALVLIVVTALWIFTIIVYAYYKKESTKIDRQINEAKKEIISHEAPGGIKLKNGELVVKSNFISQPLKNDADPQVLIENAIKNIEGLSFVDTIERSNTVIQNISVDREITKKDGVEVKLEGITNNYQNLSILVHILNKNKNIVNININKATSQRSQDTEQITFNIAFQYIVDDTDDDSN